MMGTPHDKKSAKNWYQKGQALRINWCGAGKINICGEPNTEKKICENFFVSLLLSTPHKLD